MRRSMQRQRDMRSRSSRTGRFIRDRGVIADEQVIDPTIRNGHRLRNTNYRYEDYGYDDGYNYDDKDYRSHRSNRRDYGKSRDEDFDYGEDCYLSKRELMEWSKELLNEVPEQDKSMFSRETIEKVAQDLSIDYKHFTFGELYVATLMLFSDFHKTLGGGNAELFIRLAKDFLEDDDIDLNGGEKLCAYYESIVCAE